MATESKIRPCTCVHDWQDARYGKHNRVHRVVTDKLGGIYYRCTVCCKTRWTKRMEIYAESPMFNASMRMSPASKITIKGREVFVGAK